MAHQPLRPSSDRPLSESQRLAEIEKICNGFVATGPANRTIYRAILERLLPPGAGLPGPEVTEAEVREAVEAVKPGYKDVFRRLRELQGDEGVRGIIKQGRRYQLIHTAVSQKKEPRRPISHGEMREIALEQGSRCTVCSKPISANGERLDADHRVPRERGGSTYRGNLQILCVSCNNAKSTQCSGCELNCNTCGWAFPEQFRPVKLRPDVIQRLSVRAREANQSVDDVANGMLDRVLNEDYS